MPRRLTGICLDARRSERLYQQVFDQIVERVRSGTFPADYRLPPSRALAEELGAHRNTVVRAYADLEAAALASAADVFTAQARAACKWLVLRSSTGLGQLRPTGCRPGSLAWHVRASGPRARFPRSVPSVPGF